MYLLDTNIVVFLLRGKFSIDAKIASVGEENCFISEITIAELKYGAKKSLRPSYQMQLVTDFADLLTVLPILPVLDLYAQERVRLEALGTPIDNFDLLIGVTAVRHGLKLVTNNSKHFTRIENVNWVDWTTMSP